MVAGPKTCRRGIALAITFVLGAVVAGCGSGGDDSSADADAALPDTPAVQRALAQKVDWKECQQLQCASIDVPLDYSDPDSKMVSVDLTVWPAGGKKEGTIFFNPGGPGGSGIEEVQGRVLQAAFAGQSDGGDKGGSGDKGDIESELAAADPLHAHYDQLGFDPRGVGSSSPVKCLSDAALDRYYELDLSPDNKREEEALKKGNEQLERGCAKDPLSTHASSVDVARDMEIMRRVLGEEKLDYLGSSYGTRLGATYAALFPEEVGQMVLDGALPPSLSEKRVYLGQLQGFDTAFDDYAKDCLSDDCPLGSNLKEVRESVTDLLSSVDEKPLPGYGGRQLNQTLALYGVLDPLYSQSDWPTLTKALVAARKGDGETLLALADENVGRGDDGSYTNGNEMNTLVNCLDYEINGTVGPEITAKEKDATLLGPFFPNLAGGGCVDWDLEADEDKPDYEASGAAPILVVGTTKDPATPYHWAEILSDELSSGVLLTREGDGHTAYGEGNDCIDSAVQDFLLKGVVPDEGTVCKEEKPKSDEEDG